MRRCTSKVNKLRYIETIRGALRDTGNLLYISKSKSPRLLYIYVETIPLLIDKFKYKKGAFLLILMFNVQSDFINTIPHE